MAATKKAKITAQEIISKYMDYVLEHEKEPSTIFKFCKEIELNEEDFYTFFGSFDVLKKDIWNTFYTNTYALITKDERYDAFSHREKMLTFFFTFFENLSLNRSYVLYVLKSQRDALRNLKQLTKLRKSFVTYTSEMIESKNDEKQLRITKYPVKIYAEGAWMQLLFLLKFWLDDDSASFEKTDIAIEKSVNTIFDVFDNTPLDSIVDLGKFLWKEKMS